MPGIELYPSELSVAFSILEVENAGFDVVTSSIGRQLREGPPSSWRGTYPPIPERAGITDRQRSVLQLCPEGVSPVDIGTRISLSASRVGMALARARDAFAALNIPHTIRRGLESGIVAPHDRVGEARQQLEVDEMLSISLASRGWGVLMLAAYLNRSEQTIKKHREEAFAALGCSRLGRTAVYAAISVAYSRSLLQPDSVLTPKLEQTDPDSAAYRALSRVN
ncbi:MAG TPA: hypothetical protein VJ836_03110 [Candidatus Saccharimonadales bacterium]|nr:hypothetical protein [Candidatus Saccharimonadales bacterium]